MSVLFTVYSNLDCGWHIVDIQQMLVDYLTDFSTINFVILWQSKQELRYYVNCSCSQLVMDKD